MNGERYPGGFDDPDDVGEVARLLSELSPAAWEGIPAQPRRGWFHRRGRAPQRRLAGFRQPGVVPRLGAVVVLFGLGVLLGALVLGGRSDSSAQLRPAPVVRGQAVVLRPLDAPSDASALATMSPSGQMIVTVQHLPASPPGTFYELWLMTNLKQLAPVSSFRVAGRGSVHLDVVLPDDPHHYAYLDVSLQRVGAGTAHSAVNVLRGAIT